MLTQQKRARPDGDALAENDAPGLNGPDPIAGPSRTRKFLSYYRPHIPLLLADLGCALIVAITALSLPICANLITKNLTGEPAFAVDLWIMGGVMLGLLVAQALATMFVDYQGHVMGAKMETAIRKEVFEHCQKLSFSFFDRQRTGQLMSRITNDVLSLAELYHHAPEDIAIALLKFIGAAAVLAFIDLPLTLIVLAVMPFAIVYALHFNGRMQRALRLSRRQIAAINEQVEDSLAGIRVVKSFANEEIESRRFQAENDRFLGIRRYQYRNEAWLDVGMTGFAQLITIAVIMIGAIRVSGAEMDVADMLTFLLCVAILLDPVRRVANVVRLLQEGLTGFHRVMDILELAPDIADRPNARELTRVRGDISFHGVAFAYDGRAPVLSGVNLDIRAGEFVALVGTSGVGKTTLCALIPRLYEASAGTVRIDGMDVRDVTLRSLRRNVGVVQQDIYLFAGTVRDNLRYGRPDATDAQLIAAAKAAHAHDFITALPDGYDSDIGQRGVKLSGGQKQRLTIARAFLKDAPILIFDEATSALDNESERAVQQALLGLARGRTTLVIAHRLSTVRHADRILVLTAEGVAEEGRHDALIARGGAYARLFAMQASF